MALVTLGSVTFCLVMCKLTDAFYFYITLKKKMIAEEEEQKTIEQESKVWVEGWERHLDVAKKVLGRNNPDLKFIERLPLKCQAKCTLLLDLFRASVVVDDDVTEEKEKQQDDVGGR